MNSCFGIILLLLLGGCNGGCGTNTNSCNNGCGANNSCNSGCGSNVRSCDNSDCGTNRYPMFSMNSSNNDGDCDCNRT